MDYKIKKEVLEATLQYLANCKYHEVYQLIQALQQCEEMKEEIKVEGSGC